MHQFKDFGITAETKAFIGDKIKVNKILNKPIQVLAYKIAASKYCEKGNGKCLYLQILLNDVHHVVFTGSVNLQEMISKVPEDRYPFSTTIIENNERYEFT